MHIPVLLNESITALDLQEGDIVVDGTFGGGGHSAAILATDRVKKLICVDLDEDAKVRFEQRCGQDLRAVFVHENYKNTEAILTAAHCSLVNKVLLDLGTSSFQLDHDTRGFSFRTDSPLLMTLSQSGSHTGFTAYDIVNEWEETSIADIIFHYGEDRASRKIARAIVAAREQGPILTSGALARIIETAIPRRGRIHPATKTFQAFRIAVNDELITLSTALDAWWKHLAPQGRIAVITFHSLEDRIVKLWMKNHVQEHNGRVITKKPIIPTEDELHANPRSRSAKLRIIEK